jgi:SAM-dependent methyltransferase
MKLNLGCSDRILKGYVNVDLCEPADEIVDLRMPWPWEDNSVEFIMAYDIIEHLPDPIHTMNEAWRVLKEGGIMAIEVPTTDGRGAFQDPTHVSFWNENSFFYFTDGNPHRERFGRAYGIRARFVVHRKKMKCFEDKVTKLEIFLVAVKK